MDAGTGLLEYGYGLLQKTPGLPVEFPKGDGRDTRICETEHLCARFGKCEGGGCKVRAEVPRERVLKHGKAGQSDTSEHSQEPGTCGTEGLASAQRLRPHGMLMPYFGWTRLGQGPAGTREKQD